MTLNNLNGQQAYLETLKQYILKLGRIGNGVRYRPLHLLIPCRFKPLRPTEDLVEVGSIVSEILFDLRIFNHIIANKGG
mgnify:CR=1 FL=1